MPQFGDNMPKFKDSNGKTFEVSEEHADQVIRPQNNFEEVFISIETPKEEIKEIVADEEVPKPAKKKQKKKAKKKVK